MSHQFLGSNELNEYISKTNVPVFDEFVEENQVKMISWCVNLGKKEPIQIYNTWKNRFVLSLRTHEKLHLILEKKGPYNKQLWDKIYKGAKELSVAKLNATIHAIGAAEKATKDAIELLANTYSNQDDATEQASSSSSSGSESDATTEVSEEDLTWERMENDHELRLHYLAHKKTKLNQKKRKYLEAIESDGTPKSSLFLLSARLLLKEKISVEEEALLALSLSGIYNHFNPFTKAFYTDNPPDILDDANHITTEPLDSSLTTLLSNIISKSSIDDMLGYIQTEKVNLSQNKKRQTDAYVMLSIAEKIIEDTEYWSKEQNEQEITFYRRFASLLDVLFNGSEIKLADGEAACESSRKPIEVNKRLFNVDDVSPSYSRKIDLILKYDDNKNVELCSNEWKRMKVSSDLKIKQQSKNLRVNAAIINNLQAEYGPSFNTILAMDMIGSKGYIYQLKKYDDYFVATPHSTIIIPLKLSDIACLKMLITSLFKFKKFYTALIPQLREKILEHEVNHNLGGVWTVDIPTQPQSSNNLIFFNTKKRKNSYDENDSNQKRQNSATLEV